MFAPVERDRVNQWVTIGRLPYDATDHLNSVQVRAEHSGIQRR
jgi:hypothetical protein